MPASWTTLYALAQLQPDDLASVVRDREGWTWTADGSVATFRIQADWWSATVRRPAISARPSHRWTVTIIHPDGSAAYVQPASTAAEAVRAAERFVRGQEG